MKRLFLLSLTFLVALSLNAQIPANYYNAANGLTGSALKQSLHDIITAGHNPVGYAGVWTAFYTTDVYKTPNQTKVWDMYSSNCTTYDGTAPYYFTIGTDQDGGSGGTTEGDVYNREHSFPKSWFGGDQNSTMGCDLNHIFATDKLVNGKRADNPYGEVTSATWTSLNGSKLGPNNVAGSGYTGIVFEPIDQYKGDFARAYFYMATRYKDEIPNWVSSYTTTNVGVIFQSNGEFQTWYYNMLYSWHIADPVSQKEIDRNNAVYNAQGNANPYISHPEYVNAIWGGGNIITEQKSNFIISPNPTNGVFNVSTTDYQNSSIYIYNINGQIIYSSTLESQQTNFDLSTFNKGIYLIKIDNSNSVRYSKIILQ